jgi:hypothetical protein
MLFLVKFEWNWLYQGTATELKTGTFSQTILKPVYKPVFKTLFTNRTYKQSPNARTG